MLLFTTKPEFALNSERVDEWMDLLGFCVALLGQGCRALAVGQVENIRRGGRTREGEGRRRQVFARRLIRHGVYAHTRNPLYLGNLLIILGLGLIANNSWWYLIVFPAFFFVYWSIVQAEEDFLLRQFGQEYIEYRHAVNRFLPRLAGLRRSCAWHPIDWRRVLRKEYGVTCAWLSMSVGLLIWERWESYGHAERAAQIDDLALCLAALLLVYLTMWRLKLAGKFRS